MPEFLFAVDAVTVAGAAQPSAPRPPVTVAGATLPPMAVAGATLPQLCAQLEAALGLTQVAFTLFDDGFGEWCAPSSLRDVPEHGPGAAGPVRIRVHAAGMALTPASVAAGPAKRTIMLMIGRNEAVRGLDTNKKVVVSVGTLEELVAQTSAKLGLPPDVVVGRATGRVAFASLDEIPDKARVQVWRPVASATLSQLPARFFDVCTRRMEALGCHTAEGIFRVSGSAQVAQELEQQITEAWDAKRVLAGCSDVHDVALLLCRWLRTQDPPIVPASHVAAVPQLVESDASAAALDGFVSALPEPGQALLRELVAFLQKIDPAATRMTADNLGAVFAPTVLMREDLMLMQQHAKSDAVFCAMLLKRLGKDVPAAASGAAVVVIPEGVPDRVHVALGPAESADLTVLPPAATTSSVATAAPVISQRPPVVGMSRAEKLASEKLTQLAGNNEAREAAHKLQEKLRDSEVVQAVRERKGAQEANATVNISEMMKGRKELLSGVGRPGEGQFGDARQMLGDDPLGKLKSQLGSAGLPETAERVEAAARRLDGGKEALLTRLRASGEVTPESFLNMLKTDPQFGEQLKTLVLAAVSDMICGVKLPDITGDRDWGSYEITGLAVKELGQAPKLSVDIQTGVRVEVGDISITFEHFQFKIDRHSHPKMKATGTGSISCVCSSFIAFDITTDENKKLKVSNVSADVSIEELPMQVSHFLIYQSPACFTDPASLAWQVVDCTLNQAAVATALKVFKKKGKDSVQQEIRQRVQAAKPLLEAKISALTGKFSGQGDKPKADAGIPVAAEPTRRRTEQRVAPPEPEPEPEQLVAVHMTPPAAVLEKPTEGFRARLSAQEEPEPAAVDVPHAPYAVVRAMNEQQERIARTWSSLAPGVSVHQVSI